MPAVAVSLDRSATTHIRSLTLLEVDSASTSRVFRGKTGLMVDGAAATQTVIEYEACSGMTKQSPERDSVPETIRACAYMDASGAKCCFGAVEGSGYCRNVEAHLRELQTAMQLIQIESKSERERVEKTAERTILNLESSLESSAARVADLTDRVSGLELDKCALKEKVEVITLSHDKLVALQHLEDGNGEVAVESELVGVRCGCELENVVQVDGVKRVGKRFSIMELIWK
ncbi:hypothetical protein HDU98_003735 [Podochytrium sp. JEL0797]|nr:hypothetical protein HDU98_003735 [Podochytrium sp. JEL0797]